MRADTPLRFASLSKKLKSIWTWTAGIIRLVLLPYRRISRVIGKKMPRGLFPRSILIIVTPMVLLQSVIGYVFMERHWESVTNRLSAALSRDIAAVVNLLENEKARNNEAAILDMASSALDLTVLIRPLEKLPELSPHSIFSLADTAIRREISNHLDRPFWVARVGDSKIIEMRINLEEKTVYIFAARKRAYQSNSHIFIVWMIGTSILLLAVAVLFLRNQIRPIQRLANAAEGFGRGEPINDFSARGALEVRRATEAFIKMRKRIERQIQQRTTMLSGVSHDLRTILTRFQLQLALMPQDSDGVMDLRRDVDEMLTMLDSYLAFARGGADEKRAKTDLQQMISELTQALQSSDLTIQESYKGNLSVSVRENAVRRCLRNLLDNAARFSNEINISAIRELDHVTIIIDDDGPGIPIEERESVFKPFYRIDQARNQDASGTGLGMAIALDIARSHGGNITLGQSDLGGLRAIIDLPHG